MQAHRTPRRHKQPGGILERHSRSCRTQEDKSASCNCEPSYQAWIYDKREGQKIRKNFGRDLSAAKGWLTDANMALKQGTLRSPSKQTVQQAGEAWLEAARRGEILNKSGLPYKPSVLRSYERTLRLRVYPDLGSAKLSELTVPELQRFVNRLIAQGMKSNTVRNTVNPLRAIYRHAIAVGDVAINPTTGIGLPAAGEGRQRTATPEEAEELLAALSENEALWATAFYGGLRRGELRALRASDVDVKAGVIHVQRSWDDVEGEIVPKSKKGTRRVPIPALLSKRLAAHMAATGRRGDDLLFGTSGDVPFAPATVSEAAARSWKLENERREANNQLVPIGLHECRHTYVSFMSRAGLSLEEIGDYVGHASTYMTDRYRHLLPDAHAEARRKADAFLSASKATGAATHPQA
jgi:integrase